MMFRAANKDGSYIEYHYAVKGQLNGTRNCLTWICSLAERNADQLCAEESICSRHEHRESGIEFPRPPG